VSDVIQTPDTATPTAPTTPVASSGEADILARKLGEQNTKVASLTEQLAAVLRERDTFKSEVDKLSPLAKEADGLRVQVQGFVNAGRESAIVERLRTALPGAEPLAIRGVLSSLAESGKINRYAEDASVEANKAIELIKSEAPSLTRPPTSAGGSAAVRPAVAKPGYRGPFAK